jgi:hypothetical protein
MKTLIFILIIFYPITHAKGQILSNNKKDTLGYFTKGFVAFNNGDILMADSLFYKSLKYGFSKDALFNYAMTRLLLKDTCTACKNFRLVGEYFNDSEANVNYRKICSPKSDTIYFSSKFIRLPNSHVYKYYEELIGDKCDSSFIGLIHKKNFSSTMKVTSDIIHPKSVDIYATYKKIDSIKYYNYIFASTFYEDNMGKVDKFEDMLKIYLNAAYKLDNISYNQRYFTLVLYVDRVGNIINSKIITNPFDILDKTTREKIELDIKNFTNRIPQLIPAKFNGEKVDFECSFLVGI